MNIEQQPQQQHRTLQKFHNEQAGNNNNNDNDDDSDNRVGGDTSTIVTNSTVASGDMGVDQSSNNCSKTCSVPATTGTTTTKRKPNLSSSTSSPQNKRGRCGSDLNGNGKATLKKLADKLHGNDETTTKDMVISNKKLKVDAIEQEDDEFDDQVMETTVAATIVGKSARCRRVDDDNDDDDPQRIKIQKMASACRTILECIGEDPNREGLLQTPERWAKALCFFCSGYEIPSPTVVTNGAVFAENHNEMVVVRNIDIHSLCEHHMVPFTGRVHIGYIPNGHVIGLSKLARIAEMYARRLQVQERLTRQIADAINETVEPLGVAVVVECTHMCMVMRGVQKTAAVTTTSAVRGCFETNSKTRAEFFSIIHGNGGIRFC